MTGFVLTLAVSFLPLFPSDHDKQGWGLRVHGLSTPGPFLAGEHIDQCRFRVSLINLSNETKLHDPLIVAYQTRALEVVVRGSDGKPLGTIGCFRGRQRDPFTVQRKLEPGGVASLEVGFASFGYWQLGGPGRHRVEAKVNFGEGKDAVVVSAPPVEFEVLDRKVETVLAEFAVPLEGHAIQRPEAERDRPLVQQVKVGDRTFLIYRRFYGPKWGGGIDGTFRLAELPGRCEMTVEGAYGDRNPLTITYKTSPAAVPAKLVINSIDGLPWTAEEERLRQERLKPVDKSIPAPKPVKP